MYGLQDLPSLTLAYSHLYYVQSQKGLLNLEQSRSTTKSCKASVYQYAAGHYPMLVRFSAAFESFLVILCGTFPFFFET